jgi:hypothetical protein
MRESGLKGTSGEGEFEFVGILRSAQDDGKGLRVTSFRVRQWLEGHFA